MPQTNLGRVAFKFQGDYSALTTYAKYDVVFDGESSFVSQIDNNLGNELVDGLNWKYLAKGNNLRLQDLQQDVTDLETDLNVTTGKLTELDGRTSGISTQKPSDNENEIIIGNSESDRTVTFKDKEVLLNGSVKVNNKEVITDIKTINGEPLIGEGDIHIDGLEEFDITKQAESTDVKEIIFSEGDETIMSVDSSGVKVKHIEKLDGTPFTNENYGLCHDVKYEDFDVIEHARIESGVIKYNAAFTANVISIEIPVFYSNGYLAYVPGDFSNLNIGAMFTDKDGNVISTLRSSNNVFKKVEIPAGAKYFKATYSDWRRTSVHLYASAETKATENKTVVIWGDSRTAQGWYNDLLSELMQQSVAVIPCGVGGETTTEIGMRSGGVDFVCDAFAIPASGTVDVNAYAMFGDKMMNTNILRNGAAHSWNVNANLNPVTINGVKGILDKKNSDIVSHQFTFTRSVDGEPISVKGGTLIESYGSKVFPDDIKILFSGANDSPTMERIDDFIAKQKAIIGSSCRYIVISDYMNTNEIGVQQTILPKMLKEQYKEFGNHVCDFYTYILKYASSDYNLPISDEDAARIARGERPSTLWASSTDKVHMNAIANEILSRLVYEKGKQLGYWN